MATQLETLYKDIADAIRDKEDTLDEIIASNFGTRIRGMEAKATTTKYPLVVNAPAGSLVTATKGSESVSITMGGVGTEVIVLPSVGTWTITATKSGYSASGSVTIAGTASLSVAAPAKVNKVTALTTATTDLAAATVGNYALFAGGRGTDYVDAVNAYNTSLTRSTPTVLSVPRNMLGGTSVGNYALFCGGNGSGGYKTTVDAYNKSLTRSLPTELSAKRAMGTAVNVGNYALFASGNIGYSDAAASKVVDAYNTSLTRSTATALPLGFEQGAGTKIGNYALMGGGYSYNTTSKADDYTANLYAYNTSLTLSTPASLSVARASFDATTAGNYALFGGGQNGSTSSSGPLHNTVDAYNTSLTRSTASSLSVARKLLAAASVNSYAIFAGGGTYSGSSLSGVTSVDMYDSSLTRSTGTGLNSYAYCLAGTGVGNYAIFAGGNSSSYNYSTVTAYQYTT